MRHKLFRPATIAVALTSLVMTGCAGTSTETSSPPPAPPQPQWVACPEGVENPEEGAAQLQCTTVPVPLNYDDPDGTQIDITISRLASENPDARRGVLLLNPGGPGGTGLDQPKFLAEQGIPQSVLDSYDLIGMDTRGVGHSSSIGCGFTDDLNYYGSVPPHASNDAMFDEQSATAAEIAKRCAANDDGQMSQVTTANMSRDLDRIRAALGEEKASFLGYSYGTALGAAYASMFPETSDRVVLDSNIGDTHLDQDGIRRYGRGMEETFPVFAQWAADRHEQYRLGRTPEEVRETYFSIADQLDRTPMDGLDGRAFRLGTFVTLYNPATYDAAAEMWQSILEPAEAAPAVEVPTPTGELTPFDNTWSVFLAVTCNDVEWPADPAAYRQAVSEDRETYPLYGAAAANIMPCAFWESEPSEPPVEIVDEGPTNILVAQNQRDPVTPLRGGELINEKFGDRSRLLTVDQSGHGVFTLGNNQCGTSIVADFLVDGTLPEQDTTCGPE